MPDKKFELGDYVEVRDRIRILYELFPQARIETDYRLTDEPDAKPKVICRAYVYRKPDDPTPAGHGTSWLYLPGSTPYTRGSEIENAETSAVGRAIGMLGILIASGMATANEIANKETTAPARLPARTGFVETAAHLAPEPARSDDGGLIGIAKVGNGQSDFELRQTPAGPAISFRLAQGRQGIKVVAVGPVAEAIATLRSTIEDQRVTCWGAISDESFAKDGRTISYQVLTLSRIQTPDGMLPAPEAESVSLFDDDEMAAIEAALPAIGHGAA